MYTNCVLRLDSLEKKFDELTRSHPAEYVEKWKAMDPTPRMVDGEVTSVYEMQVKNGASIGSIAQLRLQTHILNDNRPTDPSQSLSKAHTR